MQLISNPLLTEEDKIYEVEVEESNASSSVDGWSMASSTRVKVAKANLLKNSSPH